MSLKITRRPYQDCAFRWSLSVAGISTGEGDCVEADCLALNGDFLLDFIPCISDAGKLVWAGDCESGGGPGPCRPDPCFSGDCDPCETCWELPLVVDGGESCSFDGTIYLCGSGDCSWAGMAGRCSATASFNGSSGVLTVGVRCAGRMATATYTTDFDGECPVGTDVTATYTGQVWDDRCGGDDPGFDFPTELTLSAIPCDYVYAVSPGCGEAPDCRSVGCDACYTPTAGVSFSVSGSGVGTDCEDLSCTISPILVPAPALEGNCFNGHLTYGAADCGAAGFGLHYSPLTCGTAQAIISARSAVDGIYESVDFRPGIGGTFTLVRTQNLCGFTTVDFPDTFEVEAVACPPTSLGVVLAVTEGGFAASTGDCGCLSPDPPTGPDKNDRIRSRWHLEYDIEAELWTLRSFNRIAYPVYTLSDSDPCDGDTKTLLLSDKGDAEDGCGVAPAEVTITRECPPDRVGKSALLEDRKPNGATGKTKRQCGCDCLDEVDDRRQCATKCASAATEGCERIDPAPDDITCRYPEAINCCANTAGKDVPCAYTVEFECDLFYDIEDVRHKIAAKQVTLRRECYFEDPCLFVAPGPESSTGGSPVMDTDGFPGAQPVCASCSDPCLTGCTWSAWTVAACPNPDLCNIVAPVSKTNCLEFRWVGVLATGFVVGDVAAVLHFVSETVGSFGSVLWRFESDDGEWISNIRPNYIIACDQFQRGCGWGDLVWSNPPVDFGLSFWISQNDSATNQCFGIGQPDLLFDFPQFGVAQTTVKLNWITCP